MVAVDKYLRKLLYEHDCVIIPDFGGLLTHQVQAQYSSRSGKFLPSQKRVAFNEVLKFDDGLLTYFISENEQISREQAQGYVKSYTESLRNQLQQEGVASVTGIGEFRANSEGKLVFEPDLTQNFNTESFGFKDIEVVELKQIVASVEEVPAAEPELVEAQPEETAEPATVRPLGWVRWVAAAVAAGLAFYLSVFYVPTVSDSALSSLNPFYSLMEYVQPLTESTAPASASTTDEPEVPMIAMLEQKGTLDAVPVASVTAEPLAEASPVVSKEEVKVPVSGARDKKYKLVAGSFTKAANAEELLAELQRKGYPEAHILDGRGLIKVAAAGFDTQKVAYASLPELEKVVGKGVWVYEQKKKKTI